jgi:hypothetical protein
LANQDHPNFDNTMVQDEYFGSALIYNEVQKYYYTDELIFQVKCPVGEGTNLKLYAIKENKAFVEISKTQILPSPIGWEFWEFTLDFSAYITGNSGLIRFKLTFGSPADVYYSEPIEVTDESLINDNDFLYLEWFGGQNTFDSFFNEGWIPFMWIDGMLKDYKPTGKASIFDNDGTPVKLREVVGRELTLNIDMIPRYLAEILTFAASHEYFYINEVQYVSTEKPNIKEIQGTNLVDFTLQLQQANLNVSSDDGRFDLGNIITQDMSGIYNVPITGHSGEQEISVPIESTDGTAQDVILHLITAVWNAGTGITIDIGTTVGGKEITGTDDPIVVSSGETVITRQYHFPITEASIYVDIKGMGADVDVNFQFIKNS